MKNCENLLPLLIKKNDEQYILLPDCSSNVSKVNYNRRKLQYLSGQKVKMMMIIIDRNEIIRKIVVMVFFFVDDSALFFACLEANTSNDGLLKADQLSQLLGLLAAC